MNKQDALQQIASRLGYGSSDTLLELLNILLSEEEARWITTLPATPQQIATCLNEGPKRVAAGLQSLFMRGLILIDEHTEQGPRYVADDNPGRLMDMILFDPRYKQFGNHFFDLWRNFFNLELVHAPRSPDHLPFRVLPVEKTVQDARGILPYERVTEIVRRAKRIAVQACPCRSRERACDTPLETCLSLDSVADYMIGRHIGREIDVNEALLILRQAEELGLVHQVENTEHPTVICACCPCCCVFLRAITRYQKEYVVAKSRYTAFINREKCTRCETCLGRCHFGAIQWRSDSPPRLGSPPAKDGLHIDSERCLGCGLCAFCCPNDAIIMMETRQASSIPHTENTFMHGLDGIPS